VGRTVIIPDSIDSEKNKIVNTLRKDLLHRAMRRTHEYTRTVIWEVKRRGKRDHQKHKRGKNHILLGNIERKGRYRGEGKASK